MVNKFFWQKPKMGASVDEELVHVLLKTNDSTT